MKAVWRRDDAGDKELERKFSQEPEDLPTQDELGGLVEDARRLLSPKPEVMENDERQELQTVEMSRGAEPSGVLDFGRLKSPRPN
jgi:hypothetical protein